VVAAFLVMTAGLTTAAAAAPGDLDVGFGRGGLETTNFGWNGHGTALARVVLRQPDGKLVVAGTGVDGGNAFALVRHLPDGRLDTAFGDAGRAVDLIGASDDFEHGIQGIALQADGSFLATGPVHDPDFTTDLALVRYHPDGSLDTDFGTAGTVRLALEDHTAPIAMAVQPDGRVLIAGYTDALGSTPVVARFHADGALDTTFGDTGVVRLDDGSRPTALTLQRDGRVLVAVGAPSGPGVVRVLLARFTPDGAPDASFGVHGVVTVGRADAVSVLTTIREVGDGRLLGAGAELADDVSRMLFVRLARDGTLDPSFGTGGVVTTTAGWASAGAAGAAELADGRIVAAGQVDDGHSPTACAVRLDADGSLDASFGDGGLALARPPGFHTLGSALALESDGGLVVAGTAYVADSASGELLLARFDAGGMLDASFGTGGTLTTPVSSRSDTLAGLTAARDGRLLAVGTSDGRPGSDLALARYHADGGLDATFGDAGRVMTDFGGHDDRGLGVVEQASGRIVAGGQMQHGSTTAWMLAAFGPDGTPDPSFGTGGLVRTDLASGYACCFFAQSDGTLVLAGETGVGTERRVTLLRHRSDGTPDPAFGANGRADGNAGFTTNAAFQQSDGKLVVVGSTSGVGGSYFAATRFNQDGLVDPTFGTNGSFFVRSTAVDTNSFSAMIERLDGGLLGVGGNGLVFLGAEGGYQRIRTGPIVHRTVLELLDGTILGAGTTSDRGQFALARYGATGVLDPGFGTAGRVLTDLGGTTASIAGLLEQPGGLVVAGGSTGTDFALARYAIAPCAGDPNACDDGDPCSQDVCTTGGCSSTRTPRLQCGAVGRAQLTLQNATDDARDQLVWKVSRGAETALAALGDPRDRTTHHLCLHAGASTASVTLPAGAGWRAAGTLSFRFRATPGSSSAVTSALVKGGGSGKVKASVKASGAALPDLVQAGVALPLTVQLVNDAGLCLGSTFAAARRNDARQLVARTP